MQTPRKPSAVHRVFEEDKPKFQLRKGEEGLSVFDADTLPEDEILANFRPGSRLTTQPVRVVESFGLKIQKTRGDENLPQSLQQNHWEIRPGDTMTRKQFKVALNAFEDTVQEMLR